MASKSASRTKAAPRPATVKLDAECTLIQASGLHSRLSGVLSRPAAVILDASETRRIDTANLQLLAAFVRDRRNNGLVTSWKGVPAALADAARITGLQMLLDLPDTGAERA